MHPFEKAVVFLMEQAASGNMGLGVPRLRAQEILAEIREPPTPQGFAVAPPTETLEEFTPQPGDKLVIDPDELSDDKEFQRPPEGLE